MIQGVDGTAVDISQFASPSHYDDSQPESFSNVASPEEGEVVEDSGADQGDNSVLFGKFLISYFNGKNILSLLKC